MIGKFKNKILNGLNKESYIYDFLLRNHDLPVYVWKSIINKVFELHFFSSFEEEEYLRACEKVIRFCKNDCIKIHLLSCLCVDENIDDHILQNLCNIQYKKDNDFGHDFFIKAIHYLYVKKEDSGLFSKIIESLENISDAYFLYEHISFFRFFRNQYFDVYIEIFCKNITANKNFSLIDFKYALEHDIIPARLKEKECIDKKITINALNDLFVYSQEYPLEKWENAFFYDDGHLILNPVFEKFYAENIDYMNQIENNSLKNTYHKYDTYLHLLQQIPESLEKASVTLKENGYNLEWIKNEKYFLIKIDYDSRIEIGLKHNGNKIPDNEYVSLKNKKSILISIYDDCFYIKKQNGSTKKIPLTIQKIGNIEVLSNLIKKYLVYRSSIDKNPFLKEICDYDWSVLSVPLTLNEIFKYHNWNQLFKSKYKDASKLNYNFIKMEKEDKIKMLIKYICENTSGETAISDEMHIEFYNGNSISRHDILGWCKEYSDITDHISVLKNRIENLNLDVTDELTIITKEIQKFLLQSGYAELFDDLNDDICSEKDFVLYKAKLIEEEELNQLSKTEIKNYIIKDLVNYAIEEPSSSRYWLEKLPTTGEWDFTVEKIVTPLEVAIRKQDYESIQFYIDELTEHYYANQKNP